MIKYIYIYIRISFEACSLSWCHYYLNMSRVIIIFTLQTTRDLFFINDYSWSLYSRNRINQVLIRVQENADKFLWRKIAYRRKRDVRMDRTGQGEKERGTRDKNDKKGNPGWRGHGHKGERRRDREPLTSKTPFPCIPRGFRWLHPPFFSASPKTLSG